MRHRVLLFAGLVVTQVAHSIEEYVAPLLIGFAALLMRDLRRVA